MLLQVTTNEPTNEPTTLYDNHHTPACPSTLMATYEPAERLSELPSISSDSIAQTVRDRFLSGFVYTDLSDSVLVSVNPFSTANPSTAFAAPTTTVASVNALETLREYVANAREPRKQRRMRVLPPHIYKLIGRAYYYMQRTGQDQGILIECVLSSLSSVVACVQLLTLASFFCAQWRDRFWQV